jgi:dTDP-4-dehydrorhamnose reductase
MKVLITGAGGLLGTSLSMTLESYNYEVYSGYNVSLPLYGKPIKMDLSDPNQINRAFEKIRPNIIIHCAAITNVDMCEQKKSLAYIVNSISTLNLILQAKKINSFFVYISTDYIFSGDKGMYKENDEPHPINFYGFTKWMGERYLKTVDIDHLIIRPSVIYGTRPASGKINFVLWLLEELTRNRSVRIVTDQYVSPTLNTNLSQMIIEAIEKELTGTYHMAGAERVSRYEFAIRVADTFGLDKSLINEAYMSDMNWIAKRPRDSSLDISKAFRTLKNKPLKTKQSLDIFKEEIESAIRSNN